MQARTTSVMAVGLIALLVAGCGGSATANERVAGCLKKQPDATQADCKGWEADGQLNDDGSHQGHKNM